MKQNVKTLNMVIERNNKFIDIIYELKLTDCMKYVPSLHEDIYLAEYEIGKIRNKILKKLYAKTEK